MDSILYVIDFWKGFIREPFLRPALPQGADPNGSWFRFNCAFCAIWRKANPHARIYRNYQLIMIGVLMALTFFITLTIKNTLESNFLLLLCTIVIVFLMSALITWLVKRTSTYFCHYLQLMYSDGEWCIDLQIELMDAARKSNNINIMDMMEKTQDYMVTKCILNHLFPTFQLWIESQSGTKEFQEFQEFQEFLEFLQEQSDEDCTRHIYQEDHYQGLTPHEEDIVAFFYSFLFSTKDKREYLLNLLEATADDPSTDDFCEALSEVDGLFYVLTHIRKHITDFTTSSNKF